jgi:two-component system, LytTR family, sensor kinase
MTDPSLPVAAPAGPAAGAHPGGALFWRVQVIGWFVFGAVYYLAVLPLNRYPGLMFFTYKMIWSATGIMISLGLAAFYRRLRVAERGLGAATVIVSICSAVVSMLWVLGLGYGSDLVTGTSNMLFTPTSFPFVALNHFLILLAWSGGYLTFGFWQRSQAEARERLAAQGLAREAQLEMLRYQLNPHFLFNAMTSVRALVGEDPERARETIGRLSDFLRYTLTRRTQSLASVADEIQIVRDYLAIEAVRFEEKLATEVEVDPCAAAEHVPVFIVHTLVENAIKHGTPLNGRLGIRVRAACKDDRLQLEVSNTGTLSDAEAHDDRIGLGNVQQRLQAMYPDRHRFELAQEGDWVRAVITIDIERTHERP